MDFDPDRDRGILSVDDRKMLMGEKEYKHRQSKVNAKSRIRSRLRMGILDLYLILREMDPEDIQKALERRADQAGDSRDRGEPLPVEVQEEIQLENGMAAAVGIVHLAGLERNRRSPTDIRFVEGKVKKGIRMALNVLNLSAKQVIVNLTIEQGEEFDALADLDPTELAAYSMTELQQAHLDGAITDEQFFGAMEEQGRLMNRTDE